MSVDDTLFNIPVNLFEYISTGDWLNGGKSLCFMQKTLAAVELSFCLTVRPLSSVHFTYTFCNVIILMMASLK